MSFWAINFIESAPVRLAALAVRSVGWLVMLSAIVIWWGPGDAESDLGRASVGLCVGGLVWAAGVLPRWFTQRILRHRVDY